MCFDIGVVTCGPNEALVISGLFYGNRPCFITGGRAVVCPCVQRVQRIPLTTLTLIIESPRVYTSQGVPISVTGVAQVNIKHIGAKPKPSFYLWASNRRQLVKSIFFRVQSVLRANPLLLRPVRVDVERERVDKIVVRGAWKCTQLGAS